MARSKPQSSEKRAVVPAKGAIELDPDFPVINEGEIAEIAAGELIAVILARLEYTDEFLEPKHSQAYFYYDKKRMVRLFKPSFHNFISRVKGSDGDTLFDWNYPRPRFGVSGLWPVDDNPITLKFFLRNSGPVEGKVVRQGYFHSILQTDEQIKAELEKLRAKDRGPQVDGQVMASGSRALIRIAPGMVPDNMLIEQINNGTKTLYALGIIDYSDSGGGIYQAEFVAKYNPKLKQYFVINKFSSMD